MEPLLLGAISYNLYQKRKNNKTCGVILISLAKGFIEKYTVLEMERPEKTTRTIQLGFYPPTSYALANSLEKLKHDYFSDEEMKKIIGNISFDKKELVNGNKITIPTFLSKTSIYIQCFLRLAKNNFASIPPGVIWTTMDLSGDEQYWLCPEEIDFSSFIVGYLLENDVCVKQKSIISYTVQNLDKIQGSFRYEIAAGKNQNSQVTIFFAKQRSLKKQ